MHANVKTYYVYGSLLQSVGHFYYCFCLLFSMLRFGCCCVGLSLCKLCAGITLNDWIRFEQCVHCTVYTVYTEHDHCNMQWNVISCSKSYFYYIHPSIQIGCEYILRSSGHSAHRTIMKWPYASHVCFVLFWSFQLLLVHLLNSQVLWLSTEKMKNSNKPEIKSKNEPKGWRTNTEWQLEW